jgi:uncharacterized protein (TIGR02680 family)
MRTLPQPDSARWRPLRAGLVDLFYYDSEEFWFRNGGLLLRGNNGTGKSKVLALTLPFLLDADLSPHRVEPDADSKKRMEWNLLLGGSHPHPERLGYSWLEFGRIDESGAPIFRTLGCGLKAVSGRGITRHWFFLTRQRVGAGLALIDATGTALTRDRLLDALGDVGTVYDRARDYRRAVDESLFGFGEQRYAALVDLLVQLRQPQLSKRPSEKALSDALTQALPPLDQALVADVAEAFHSLEEDRQALGAMTEARDAARSFLGHYQRYARIVARKRARGPREAQSALEKVSEELSTANEAFEAADRAHRSAAERRDALEAEHNRLRARVDALNTSPEMRDATELNRAAGDAERLAAEAGEAQAAQHQAHARLSARNELHRNAANRLTQARTGLETARGNAVDAASRAVLTPDHEGRVDSRLTDDIAAVRQAAERLAQSRQHAITHVSELVSAAHAASAAVLAARAEADRIQSQLDELAAQRTDAEQAVSQLGTRLVAAVRAHTVEATELVLPDPAATMAELELWVETLAGPNPAVTSVSTAGQLAAAGLASADTELEVRERVERSRAAELEAEIARLERGEHTAPPVPHTRADATRADRPGAPLWQLVDFSCDDEADRSGLEAALEASGILDAWVTPTGELLSAETDDVVVRPGAVLPHNLGAVLRPAVDRDEPRAGQVSDQTVADILASIGLGDHDDAAAWADVNGRFGIGVLTGAWHKPSAEYIGRGAREAARRVRLDERLVELDRVREELERLGASREELKQRLVRLADEVAGLPGDEALRQAHASVASLLLEAERLAVRHGAAKDAVLRATAAAEQACAARDEAGRDTGLPTDTAALEAVRTALADYRVALAGLWPAVGAARSAEREATQTAADAAEAQGALESATTRAGGLRRNADAADERHRSLRETVGAAVAEFQAQLAHAVRQMTANELAQGEARAAAERAIEDRGTANGLRELLTSELEAATAERAAAADAFRRFAGTGLLAVAVPGLEIPDTDSSWAPHPTVRLARRVNDSLAEVPDDDNTWERAQHRLNTELKTLHDTLSRRGNKASADLREDGVVVEVEFQGRPSSVPDLAAALDTEVAERERLLNEREREILENHLVNEVAGTLQELITAAEEQVASMNRELEARPTSTGMRLRLQWQPRDDGPAGLATARQRLLRQTADAWSASDREAVGDFLQARIAETRARDTSGTWVDQLAEALDYRTWNRFVIQRYAGGQWRSATGPASGGERVLTASVPLFAAASAHYASSGNPHAPRLVTLDEAFAGVDDNARAKYLGLLAAFDLDVVMTSEREWGCYLEVPGLAISSLSRIDGIDAVHVENWEWDGTSRSRIERERPQLVEGGPADRTSVPAPQDGLWS